LERELAEPQFSGGDVLQLLATVRQSARKAFLPAVLVLRLVSHRVSGLDKSVWTAIIKRSWVGFLAPVCLRRADF
jgi:hypothetical protein